MEELPLTFRRDVSRGRFYSFLRLIFHDELGDLATTDVVLIDLVHDHYGNFAIDTIRLEPVELYLDQFKGSALSERPWTRHDHGRPSHEALQRLRNAMLPSLVGIVVGLLACTVGFALGWVGLSIYVCIRGWTESRSGTSKMGEGEEEEKEEEEEEEELISETSVHSKMEQAPPWSEFYNVC